ncbi:MAG: N-acetylneuraminate synthase family protein, partial [Thermoanaerobaculaceae bacterium]|nr:N-acetylneuraminate synthase family protein [Thermoanaerobaculaceae bacterium]
MSANHARDLSLARRIIKEAKRCGADAVKIQTYVPDTMTMKSDKPFFRIGHSKWKGRTLYDLYKEAHTPWKWHEELKRTAEREDIILFSTPFDKTAVDMLEDLRMPLYKVASFELTDLPMIKRIAWTGRPIIMSTGMATLSEIKEAVRAAKGGGAKDIILLK